MHRVQRVPITEAQGRIHTSAVTVAILPEADEVELKIDPNDLRIDVFHSSGHGGQSVNTTDSAVRIAHLPTGLVVTCQDEKSQLKNKHKAMKVLRARLLDAMVKKHNDAISETRKNQVGSGDRSERIRTYNYPQGRVTDHRIGLTSYSLESFLNGDIGFMIDALTTHFQAEALSNGALMRFVKSPDAALRFTLPAPGRRSLGLRNMSPRLPQGSRALPAAILRSRPDPDFGYFRRRQGSFLR